MGFNDGVFSPRPGSGFKFDSVVWTTERDEDPENEDKKFIEDLTNDEPMAKDKLRKLLNDQSDPDGHYFGSELFKNNALACSHARKANPRQEKLPNGK